MTQETLQMIHEEYVNAVGCSRNILSITKNLYERLNSTEIPECDQKQFDLFLAGLLTCIRYRENTNDFTSLMDGITTTIVYITIFMNNRRNKTWVNDIIVRRKSLERDLSKILRKALKEESPNIRDRFGACIILSNEDDFTEEQLYSELHEISDTVQGILCGTNRQLRKEFIEFVSSIVNPLIKPQIDVILQLPFIAEFFKDYVANPKPKGYQSIHVSLRVDSTAFYFAGAVVELQFRSKTMNDKASFGPYGHDGYEEDTSSEVKDIFHIPDAMFDSINVIGFTSYEPKIGDMDGIGSAKFVITRRASASLIPQYS